MQDQGTPVKYSQYSVLSSVYYKENPEYLRQSIDSMVCQTLVTDDYIIIKDGPLTNELEAVLAEYEGRYSFIHIYSFNKNRGLGAALNYGLKKCKNELVARMDTDDISMPKRCEIQMEIFEKNMEFGIVGSSMYEFSANKSNAECLKAMPVTSEEIYKYGKRRNPFNHPTVMYKKSIILNSGGYIEEKRGEDYELFTRLISDGVKGYNISIPLLKYRAVSDQFSRRTSWIDTKAVLGVGKRNYQRNYSGTMDFLYIVVFQIGGMIIPKSIGNKLYKTMLRKGI